MKTAQQWRELAGRALFLDEYGLSDLLSDMEELELQIAGLIKSLDWYEEATRYNELATRIALQAKGLEEKDEWIAELEAALEEYAKELSLADAKAAVAEKQLAVLCKHVRI